MIICKPNETTRCEEPLETIRRVWRQATVQGWEGLEFSPSSAPGPECPREGCHLYAASVSSVQRGLEAGRTTLSPSPAPQSALRAGRVGSVGRGRSRSGQTLAGSVSGQHWCRSPRDWLEEQRHLLCGGGRPGHRAGHIWGQERARSRRARYPPTARHPKPFPHSQGRH